MEIRFLNVAILVAAPLVALIWWIPRGAKRRAQVLLRAVLLLVLLSALARPVLLISADDVHHVLVLDRSASVTPTQRRDQTVGAERVLQEIINHGNTSLVVIGAEADAPGDALGEAQLASATYVTAPRSESSLSAALAAALRQIPEGARGDVHLFSDGLSTDRNWARELQQIIERGIVVNAYDLGSAEDDVYPAGFDVEELLRVGQTARVAVHVVGAARGIRVELVGASGEVLAVSAPADSDGRVTIPMTFEPPEAGFLEITARVSSDGRDVNPRNNAVRRVVAIQDPLRVLYLGDRMRSGAARIQRLLGRGFDVTDGSRQAVTAAAVEATDLVLLDDRPASRVPDDVQREVIAAVTHRGLGLIVSGGKAAFGAGGYDATPIASILPVDVVQRTERRDPSAALAIIIDTSGSMAGSRIDLAKQVARLAVRRLKAHDRIGIVEFYGNKHWALPLQSAANKIAIDRAIGRMQAIGGTVLMPAIEEAYYGLKNVDARYKHIVIITDAGVEESDYESMVRLIAKDGVNLSTVLVGAEAHNQVMIDMASWGKGRFYSASDRYNLPELILKQPSTMKLPAYKTGVFPVRSRGGAGWWSDIDRRSVPPLNGYVETTTRPGAEVLIETHDSADPVLATWRYGLGSVSALMTEPVGEGTQSWRSWHDYGRLLARVVGRTADDSRLFGYDITREDDLVTITARRHSADARLRPRAFVLNEQEREQQTVAFHERAPGLFDARVTIAPGTSVRLLAAACSEAEPDERRQPTRLISLAADEFSAEDQVDPARALDLEALASATGGRFTDADAVAAGRVGDDLRLTLPDTGRSWSAFALWPWLLLVALILYLAEIVIRRSLRGRQ